MSFERHNARDDGHAGDAASLFIATAERSHFELVEPALQFDLDCRSELLDAWD